MSGYRKVSSDWLSGRVGRAIRGDADSYVLAYYLMTAKENIKGLGLFWQPIEMVSIYYGLPIDRLSIAYETLSRLGFSHYSAESEFHFVTESARHEWGEEPNTASKAVQGMRPTLFDQLDKARNSSLFRKWLDRYAEPWAPVLAPILERKDRLSIAYRLAIDTPEPSPDPIPDPLPEPVRAEGEAGKPATPALSDPGPAEAGDSGNGKLTPAQEISDLLGGLVARGVEEANRLWSDRLACTVSSKRPNRKRQIFQLKKIMSGLDTGRSPADAVEILELAAEGGWSGVKWEYLDSSRDRGRGAPRRRGSGRFEGIAQPEDEQAELDRRYTIRDTDPIEAPT